MTLLRTLVAALAATLLLSGCSQFEGTGDKAYISGDGQLIRVEPADRDEPVDLTGEGLTGEQLSLPDLRGKVVVVNVWGSWCPPCRAEMPDLVEAHDKIVDKLGDQVAFVGVNQRDPSVEQARAFNRTFDVPWDSFYSPDGKALLEFRGRLSPYTIPATLVLDTSGRVAATIVGRVTSASMLVGLVEDTAKES